MSIWRLSCPRRLYLGLLGAVACGGGAEGGDAAGSEVQVSDSAGVTSISLGRVEDLSVPELETQLIFSTRELGVELFYAGDAVLLGDGSLALANTGASEVLLFSGGGALATRVGGRGEGPGEFSEITSLIGTPEGFVAYDARLARLTEFSGSGELLDSQPLSARSSIVDLRPLATAADGRLLAILGEQRRFFSGGIRRDTTPLLAFTDIEAEPDTLARLPAREWNYGVIPGGGATRTEAEFGRDIVAGGFRDRAILGDTDLLELSVHTAEGRLTRRIRGTGGGWPVTADEVETSRAARLARRGSDAPDWYVRVVENAPYRETHPAFHSAVLGPDELVWIGLAARPADETRDWLVIGPGGQPRGRLSLPAKATVLAVDADRFAVLHRDALDEEEVRLYRYR